MPLRERGERETLSVSRKSLKQGKLELLFGLCFLEVGNLRLNGTLKQGRSKHSNIPLSKGCSSFHSLFKNFHFFINVLSVFFVFFKGILFQVFIRYFKVEKEKRM